MNDLSNILSEAENITEQQLLNYLHGKASPEETHQVEKMLADEGMLDDALEGLQKFSSKQKLDDYVKQVNKNLQQQIQQKKQRKEKRRIKNISWTIAAIVFVLLLCLLTYAMIMYYRNR